MVRHAQQPESKKVWSGACHGGDPSPLSCPV